MNIHSTENCIELLKFCKDLTQHMKWEGNSEITVLFSNLYSQKNFDRAIHIIQSNNTTSQEFIHAIQILDKIVFTKNHIDILEFLIYQQNNKHLRDKDILAALENRIKKGSYAKKQSKRRFKFKGGKSKKIKKK